MPADSFIDEDHPLMRDAQGMTIILAKELDPIGQFLHELADLAHEADGITRCQTGRNMLLADADVVHEAAELLTKASERLKLCGMPF